MSSRFTRFAMIGLVAAVFLTGTAAYGIRIPKKTDKQPAKQESGKSKNEKPKNEKPKNEEQQKAEELYLQGEKYDEEDQSEKAMECFRQAAELGHDKAQILLAYTYMTEDRTDEAIMWYRKAAAQGNTAAPTLLGRIYFENEQYMNMKEAAKWFRMGAEQGQRLALRQYGICCFEGYGVTQDREEAVKWFRKAAELFIPEPEAQYMLGICYRDGLGVTQDRAEAVKWFRKAADYPTPDGAYGLGVCYMEGYGVKQDMKEAVKCFLKAAEQGRPYALCALGVCYRNGLGVTEDPAKAKDYFKKAMEGGHRYSPKGLPERAEDGDHEALYWLGVCYEEGWGVEQDDVMAVACLLGAEQDNDRAQVALARHYLKTGDRKAAERWLRKAAKRDNPTAKKLLTEVFPGKEAEEETDKSVQAAETGATIEHLQAALKTGDAEAVAWIQNAAEQGDSKAQCGLGICYSQGYGVTKDSAEAKKWFAKGIDGLRKAAESGDPEAQTLLAGCYGEGNGVKADQTLSLIWLRKAAEQDFARAQLALALTYVTVDKDRMEADKWFRKAAENGESDAVKLMKQFLPDPAETEQTTP